MATSGVYTKTYTADYVVRRAVAKCGGEPTSGTEAEDYRDLLNELLWEIANRYQPLSRIKQKSVPVSSSVNTYELGSSVIAVYDAIITWSSVDYAMGRMNRYDYFNIPNKKNSGKPSQFVTEEYANSTRAYLYPTPSQNDTMKFYAAIRPQIVTRPTQELDVHDRYIPAIIVGLAYKISFERRGIDPSYRMELKQEYDNLLMSAAEEDKERVNMYISPALSY